MSTHPTRAMVLAAGLGTRMRPLTETTAKPLLTLGGQTLLDHSLDRLAEAGVTNVVVNAFWQGGKVVEHIAARRAPPSCTVRREVALLDTGGGVRDALPMLGDAPFYVVNGDAFWIDGPAPMLRRLARAFDDTVDCVLLVHRTANVLGEVGPGDFTLDKLGVPTRRQERHVAPYLYAGVHLIAPALLRDFPAAAFSMNAVWDQAMATGRLRAVVHDGLWFHLSTPPDLIAANTVLNARWAGDARLPWN